MCVYNQTDIIFLICVKQVNWSTKMNVQTLLGVFIGTCVAVGIIASSVYDWYKSKQDYERIEDNEWIVVEMKSNSR